jgi:hypothetical protein
MTVPGTTHIDSDPPIVCRVTADGEVICETPPPDSVAAMRAADSTEFAAVLAKSFPGVEWGPQRTELALRLLATLAESKLPDARIARRAGQSVGAVKDLLRPEPPSILLFNYSEQPADVMGAWFLNKAQLARMQRVIRQFEKTVEP